MPSHVKPKNDLRDMARYTEQRCGRDQRLVYLKQIDAAFQRLCANPEIGRACDDICPGYRKLLQGSHLIFYRKAEDGVLEIVRVLHESMDVDSALG